MSELMIHGLGERIKVGFNFYRELCLNDDLQLIGEQHEEVGEIIDIVYR